MSAFNYSRVAATATRLLRRFGQPIRIRKISTGPYDTGSSSADMTQTDQSGVGAVFDYPLSNQDGTLIRAGDKQVYLAVDGVSTPPQPNHLAIIGSETFTVINCKPLAPSGMQVLYELQVRK